MCQLDRLLKLIPDEIIFGCKGQVYKTKYSIQHKLTKLIPPPSTLLPSLEIYKHNITDSEIYTNLCRCHGPTKHYASLDFEHTNNIQVE